MRTLQNWEKRRGLPIHRDGDSRKPRVVAYVDELEAWRKREETAARPVRTRERSRRILLWVAGVGGAVLILVAAIVVPNPTPAPHPRRVAVQGNSLLAYGPGGEILWERPFPKLGSRYAHPSEMGHNWWVGDLDADGRAEVLFVEDPGAGLNEPSTLHYYGPEGKERWVYTVETTWTIHGTTNHPAYDQKILGVVRVDGRDRVLVYSKHQPGYLSVIALIDPRDGSHDQEYWHPGHIYSAVLHDLDDDGQQELLVGGRNNPGTGPGYPFVALLDLPIRQTGDSTEGGFFPGTTTRAEDYVLLQRPDVADAGATRARVHSLAVRGREIIARVSISKPLIHHRFDFGLNPLSYAVTEDAREIHDAELAGELDHELDTEEERIWGRVLRFERVPDGNAQHVADAFSKYKSPATLP